MTVIDTVFEGEIKELTSIDVDLEKLTSYTLADAIRGGSSVTEKCENWGGNGHACALTAAAIHIRAMQQK